MTEWPTSNLVWCAVPLPDPETHVFHRCRTDVTQFFLISGTCIRGQVIHIQSAEVGFSDQCSLNEATCTRSTNHTEIMKCNGLRSCNFSQDVLDYPPDDKLCADHQKGTFIRITYHCINGKRTYVFLNFLCMSVICQNFLFWQCLCSCCITYKHV